MLSNFGFLYRWFDLITGMMYIGVHKGNIEDGYVCSSKYMKRVYVTRAATFIREIIQTGDYDEMRKLEIELLTELDAKHDPVYYNRTNGTHVSAYQHGPRSLESIEKGRRKVIGRKKPKEWVDKVNKNPEKIRRMAETHRGMKRSVEARKKMSDAKKGYIPWNKGKTGIYSEETKNKIGTYNRGKIWFHNPDTLKNYLFHPDTAPSNLVRGMKKCR